MRTDEGSETNGRVFRNDAIISISAPSSTEHSRADVSAVAAGSFTLNWSVQTNTAAMVIHYEVYGGTDITNVSAFSSNTQNTSTGNHSWNGTGTTFTPEFALILNATDQTASDPNVYVSNDGHSVIQLGCATSTSKQWIIMGRQGSGTNSLAHMCLDNGNCIGSLSSTTGSLTYLGTFVSFDNAAGGGITINITNAATATDSPIGFLLVKGGKWDCNVFQQRSGTGTQDVTLTDSTVTPRLVHLAGLGTATEGSGVANHYMCLGGSDGTREGNCYMGSTNALANYVIARSTDTGKVYRMATPNATATSSTTVAECDMSDMSTAGQFTLNWTTADTTLRQMAFFMCGEVAAGTTPVSETSIHKYDLAAYATQTNIHKYNLAAYVTQNNIEKYHILNFISQNTIHKYNLLQNILQSSIQKYNLLAYALQSSIHKYNLLQNILRTNIHKYDILNTVPPQTSIHKYDIRKNIAQTSIQKYHLFANILQSSIHKYNLIQYIAQSSIHKYSLIAYIAQTSIHKYSLLVNVLQSSIHKYDIQAIAAVLQTLIAKYDIRAYITQTNIHKYNLLAYIAQTSIHKYNLLVNILGSSIHKYNILQNIVQNSKHKYDLLQNVVRTSIHKYNILANILQSTIHKYNLLQYILQTSIHKYDLQVLGAVVNALIAKYNILQYISQTNVHKYSLLQNVLQSSIHKYNLLVNILQNSISKYNILQNVIAGSLHKYNLLQNVIQSSIHKYDILVEALTVLANSIHKYDLLQNILQTSKHKYDLLNTVARTSIHKYNILANVLRSSIHKYSMGGIVASQSRHLYNIIRETLGSIVSTGRAHKPRLKTIKYPVYHVQEYRRLERRRLLRREFPQPVIIPAFKWNIHRVVAPFVINLNPVRNEVRVKFALRKNEPVLYKGAAIPLKIAAKTSKNQANTAHSDHVMQQKPMLKYGKRLNKIAKLMALFLAVRDLKEEA